MACPVEYGGSDSLSGEGEVEHCPICASDDVVFLDATGKHHCAACGCVVEEYLAEDEG